jgi:hypothetical protein
MHIEKKSSCPIINNLKGAIETVKTIESYLSDPKQTIQDEIAKISYGKNSLDEVKLRNLEKGLNSDLTYHVATSLGKKELADALSFRIEEIKKHFKSKFTKIRNNSKILNNALKALDENFNNGAIETRWAAINSSQLYRNTFLQRLERDFEPSLRGIQYRIDFNIDTKKLLIILKVFIDKLLEKQSVNKLLEVNTAIKNLLDLTQDLEHMEVVVPQDALDEQKVPAESRTFQIEVPILTKEDTGKLIREVALKIENLDDVSVDILAAIDSLREPLEKYYQKSTGDINVISDVLVNGYTSIVEETLPRIQTAIDNITLEFIDTHTTTEAFHNRITNYLNVLIRIIDIENFMSTLAYEVTSDVAKDFSDYLALYNLYTLILLYGVTSNGKPKVDRPEA